MIKPHEETCIWFYLSASRQGHAPNATSFAFNLLFLHVYTMVRCSPRKQMLMTSIPDFLVRNNSLLVIYVV